VLAIAATGCNTLRGFPAPPQTTDVAAPAPGWQLGPQAVQAYNAASSPDEKKALRNEIIDARMAAIDVRFGDYERALYQEGIGSGLGTDWVELALGAATTVVGAASTKTALGAATTAVVGGQASFDKRALFDKTLPALLSQMVAERETIRTEVRIREGLAVADYTWSAADSDLQRYQYAGSIPGAISTVAQDAGQKAATAKRQLQDIKSGQYRKSDAASALRQFWRPGGAIDPDNEAQLKHWMTENGISTNAGMIAMFLSLSTFEAARVKAVKDLGLETGT
jgi:hypothetical protein